MTTLLLKLPVNLVLLALMAWFGGIAFATGAWLAGAALLLMGAFHCGTIVLLLRGIRDAWIAREARIYEEDKRERHRHAEQLVGEYRRSEAYRREKFDDREEDE